MYKNIKTGAGGWYFAMPLLILVANYKEHFII